MNGIKVLLILALMMAFFVFQRYVVGKRLLVRMLAVLMLGSAVLAVAFPRASTIVANFFGIGRGVDFIIYIMIIFLMYAIILLHANVNRLRIQLSTLAREQAINQARSGFVPRKSISEGLDRGTTGSEGDGISS